MSGAAPPTLLPHESTGSMVSASGESSVAVSDILLRILSKLTVYQALPELAGSPVVAVSDSLLMVDAIALFLPVAGGPGPLLSSRVLEVHAPARVHDDQIFIQKSKQTMHEDPVRSRAFQAQLNRPESIVADFLSVADVLFFLAQFGDKSASMTVAEWIDAKVAAATSSTVSSTQNKTEWVQFCEESTLLVRGSLSLSPNAVNGVPLSSSSMNMSVSSLLKASTSMGDLIAPGSHLGYWRTQLRTLRTGGSSLMAVCALLSRPWQSSLPLTVTTEKGIDAIFAYISLAQLMAHVAMNCSDKLLEPFFSVDIEYNEFANAAAERLCECSILHHATASVADAISVLTTSPYALLSSRTSGALRAPVVQDDLLHLLAQRINMTDPPLLESVRIADHISAGESGLGVMRLADFPCAFSTLLQNVLQTQTSAIVVVDSDAPIGIITVRDVWTFVMQGASVLKDL